jgi:hypothetical protein
MSLSLIERVIADLREEPEWRSMAAKEEDYYDGNQLDSEYLAAMEDRGMFPVVRNMIAPALDVVLGMEARNRQDFRVFADEDEDSDVAVALSDWLHEWERMSKADRACSDAYKSQVSVGLGWVEVGRNRDPFGYPHRCFAPRRTEMFWDWRAREPDLSDARYLLRRKWFDRDLLVQMFPGQRRLIDSLGVGTSYDTDIPRDRFEMLSRHWDVEARTDLEDTEWADTGRNRLCLYELWHREWQAGKVLRIPDLELTIQFDEANPQHAGMVQAGLAEVVAAILPTMRLSWWIGPHQLAERGTPYSHNEFPYVPFVGMRESRTGIPYGLIRRMMSPQDEVNTRLTKMLWLLSAKRLMADSDAFMGMDWADVIAEMGRPDAAFPLNPNRANRNQMPRIESDRELAAQQFTTMQEAMRFVSEAAGIYQAMQGKEMTQQSGIAIQSLVDQGATTLAEINDNFRLARAKVGELGMANVIQERMDRSFERQIARGREKFSVWFNRQIVDEQTGETTLDNRLDRLRTRVELADVPSTPTFRAQFLSSLLELTKTLPDDLKRVLIPTVVEASELPRKNEIADELRRAMGQGGQDPEQTVGQQQAMAQEQVLAMQEREAQVRERMGRADQAAANADKALSEAQQARAEVQAVMQQIQAAGSGAEQALLAEAMQRRQMQLAA